MPRQGEGGGGGTAAVLPSFLWPFHRSMDVSTTSRQQDRDLKRGQPPKGSQKDAKQAKINQKQSKMKKNEQQSSKNKKDSKSVFSGLFSSSKKKKKKQKSTTTSNSNSRKEDKKTPKESKKKQRARRRWLKKSKKRHQVVSDYVSDMYTQEGTGFINEFWITGLGLFARDRETKNVNNSDTESTTSTSSSTNSTSSPSSSSDDSGQDDHSIDSASISNNKSDIQAKRLLTATPKKKHTTSPSSKTSKQVAAPASKKDTNHKVPASSASKKSTSTATSPSKKTKPTNAPSSKTTKQGAPIAKNLSPASSPNKVRKQAPSSKNQKLASLTPASPKNRKLASPPASKGLAPSSSSKLLKLPAPSSSSKLLKPSAPTPIPSKNSNKIPELTPASSLSTSTTIHHTEKRVRIKSVHWDASVDSEQKRRVKARHRQEEQRCFRRMTKILTIDPTLLTKEPDTKCPLLAASSYPTKELAAKARAQHYFWKLVQQGQVSLQKGQAVVKNTKDSGAVLKKSPEQSPTQVDRTTDTVAAFTAKLQDAGVSVIKSQRRCLPVQNKGQVKDEDVVDDDDDDETSPCCWFHRHTICTCSEC